MLKPPHFPSSLRSTKGGTRMVPNTSFAEPLLAGVSLLAGPPDTHPMTARAANRRSIAAAGFMDLAPPAVLLDSPFDPDVARPPQQRLAAGTRAEIEKRAGCAGGIPRGHEVQCPGQRIAARSYRFRRRQHRRRFRIHTQSDRPDPLTGAPQRAEIGISDRGRPRRDFRYDSLVGRQALDRRRIGLVPQHPVSEQRSRSRAVRAGKREDLGIAAFQLAPIPHPSGKNGLELTEAQRRDREGTIDDDRYAVQRQLRYR